MEGRACAEMLRRLELIVSEGIKARRAGRGCRALVCAERHRVARTRGNPLVLSTEKRKKSLQECSSAALTTLTLMVRAAAKIGR